ncbi:MAG: cation transporter, partial [Aminobacterium sp.]|nr:cation transporter [Aminobacterium sp.]
MEINRGDRALAVTLRGFWVNLILTILKYIAGFVGHSGAMVADATHSLSDLITDVVVFFGFKVVNKPADSSHRYGHGKVETLLASL